MPTERLFLGSYLLDPTQSVDQAASTTDALETACAAICPDGTAASQWRYDQCRLHALRN